MVINSSSPDSLKIQVWPQRLQVQINSFLFHYGLASMDDRLYCIYDGGSAYDSSINYIDMFVDPPQLEDIGYILPPEMSSIITATIADTSQGEVILCHDNAFIFAAKVVKGGSNVTFQKFSLPSVALLHPVIKNYFLAILDSKRMIVFDVSFNEQGKIVLKFVFNKDRQVSSFFLREVAENMAELQIFFPDNEVTIHQFTVNGKVGIMNYGIAAQNKIRSCERQQLYGSKTMLCMNKRNLYYFTNFSNKFVSAFSLSKFETDMLAQHNAFPLAYVSRLEEFYVLLSNYNVVNVMNQSQQHKVYCEQGQAKLMQQLIDPREVERYKLKTENGLKVTSYFDMVLIEDMERGVSFVFQLKQKGSALIGVEYGKFNWFWTCSRKLVGLSFDRNRFKIIEQIKINEFMEGSTYSPTSPNKIFRFKENTNDRVEGDAREERVNFKNVIKPDPNKKDEDTPSPQKNFSIVPGLSFYPPMGFPKMQGFDPTPFLIPQHHLANFPKIPGVTQKPTEEIIRQSTQPPLSNPIESQRPQIPVEIQQKYKPKKIIQKNKVSVSKSVNKSKEIQPITQTTQPEQQKPIVEETKQEKQAEIEEKITRQCEKIAQSILDQQEENIKPTVVEAQKQQVQSQEQAGEASCQEQEAKKEGDIFPKEEDQMSEGLDIPQQNADIPPVDDSKPVNTHQAVSKKQTSKQSENPIDSQKTAKLDQQSKQESNLPKSLAVIIGKSALGGAFGHPLNPFITSINRNNIFNSINGQTKFGEAPQQLRRYHSQQEDYYNPLTSASLFLSPKKEVEKDEPKQQQKEESKASEEHTILIEKVKELFDETSNRLVKVVEELANIKMAQPYLKDKIIDQMKKNIREILQKLMVGEFTSRIERYFYEIFRQTDQVQQQSIKFYKQANNHRQNNTEVHLKDQEKIVKEIRDIQSNLRFCISNLKEGNKATFEGFLRDWTHQAQETKHIIEDLNTTRVKIEIEEQARAKRYEQTKQNLETIKALLLERINIDAEKKQRKADREKLKKIEHEQRLKKEKKKKVEKKSKKSTAI